MTFSVVSDGSPSSRRGTVLCPDDPRRGTVLCPDDQRRRTVPPSYPRLTLAKLDPEYHQTGVRVSAAHILDEFNLIGGVLLWMAVGTVRVVCEGLKCSVVFLAPTVDILPSSLVADSCLCYAVIERILNYYLLKPHVLCYLTHSE